MALHEQAQLTETLPKESWKSWLGSPETLNDDPRWTAALRAEEATGDASEAAKIELVETVPSTLAKRSDGEFDADDVTAFLASVGECIAAHIIREA